MPICQSLDVFMCADTHKRQIERTRQSVESTYRYGTSRMAAWLSILEMDIVKDMPKTTVNLVSTLVMMRARLSSILPNHPRLTDTTDLLGYTNTRDRVILAYEIMYSAVSNILAGHRGAMHMETCPICISIWQCLAVDQAVRECLPAVVRSDDARRALLSGPPVAHRCHITCLRIRYGRVWRVTCLVCGVVSKRPYGNSATVADIARLHASTAPELDRARRSHG